MEAQHQETIGHGAVEQGFANPFGGLWIEVRAGSPEPVDVEKRIVGGVGGDEQLIASRMNKQRLQEAASGEATVVTPGGLSPSVPPFG